jgi:predicted DNA-binding ribbon-helix-helix protein
MTIRLDAYFAGELAALASEYDLTIDQLVNGVAKQALRDGSAVRGARLACQLRAADELADEAQQLGLY